MICPGISSADNAPLSAAEEAFARGRWLEVEELLLSRPRNDQANLLLGRALLRLGRPGAAIPVLEEAASQTGDLPEYLYYLGCALARNGDLARADAIFTRALDLDESGKIHIQRGHVRLRWGKLQQAYQDYCRGAAQGKSEDGAKGLEALGCSYSRRHRPELASRMFEAAGKLGRWTEPSRWLAGWSYYQLGRLRECLEHWVVLGPAASRQAAAVWQLCGLRAAAAANWPDAIECWREAERLGARVREDLIETYLRCSHAALRGAAGSPDSAGVGLEQAAALSDGDPRATYYYALLLARTSFPGPAIRLLEKAGSNGRLLLLLGQLRYAAGDFDAACCAWTEAMATDGASGAQARSALTASLADCGQFDRLWAMSRERGWPERAVLNSLWSYAADSAAECRWREAAQAIQECLRADPERAVQLGQFPAAAVAVATVFVMAGLCRQAHQLLRPVQRAHLHDARVTRFLVVSSYWQATRDACHGNTVGALAGWREMTKDAVLLLHHPDFWSAWCAARLTVYDAIPHLGHVEAFRRLVEANLLARLGIATPEGMEFRIELGGARALAEAGGLKLPSINGPLICGLAMMRDLHCSQMLGHAIEQRGSNNREPAELNRVMSYFSQLATAQALFDFDRPKVALDALGRACCQSCAAAAGQPEAWMPKLCADRCALFSHANPAYHRLPGRAIRLGRDAARLAVQCHLAVATSQLAAAQVDVRGVARAWSEAIRLAVRAEWNNIPHRVATEAWGWAGKLQDREQLEEAAGVLECAWQVCGESCREMLAGPMAEAINLRGVWHAGNADLTAAQEDFARAHELNPAVPVILHNLISSSRQRAESLAKESPAEAAELLAEVRRLLAVAAREFPDESWIEEQRPRVETAGEWIANGL